MKIILDTCIHTSMLIHLDHGRYALTNVYRSRWWWLLPGANRQFDPGQTRETWVDLDPNYLNWHRTFSLSFSRFPVCPTWLTLLDPAGRTLQCLEMSLFRKIDEIIQRSWTHHSQRYNIWGNAKSTDPGLSLMGCYIMRRLHTGGYYINKTIVG